MSYEQWAMSRKLLQSYSKLTTQGSKLVAQGSKLIAHFANFARDYFVGLLSFYIFVAWIGNQIKKGGNGKQKDYSLDWVKF